MIYVLNTLELCSRTTDTPDRRRHVFYVSSPLKGWSGGTGVGMNSGSKCVAQSLLENSLLIPRLIPVPRKFLPGETWSHILFKSQLVVYVLARHPKIARTHLRSDITF